MSTRLRRDQARKDEGAFGSALALLVVGGFLALAARLTDGGPVETLIADPTPDAPILARPDPSEPLAEAATLIERPVLSSR